MRLNTWLSAWLLCTVGLLFVVPAVPAEVINSGVAFQETGLPAGTMWAVVCNGTQYNSTSPEITISLPPGTYNFYIPQVAGFTASPKSGNVTAIIDPIRLTPITFSPTIPEFTVNPLAAAFTAVLVFAAIAVIVKKKAKSKSSAMALRG